MSNDPLALSAITGGLPQEAEYDAVYAAVTATERGRWFLTEYASRNRHADTELITAALARIEAAIDEAPQPAAVSVGDLAAIAATIDRIGGAIEGERGRISDIAAAAGRITAITSELRERAVKTALCDALDAAAREIGSGSEQDEANAIQSLRELGDKVRALIIAAGAGEAAGGVVAGAAPENGTPASAAPAAAHAAEHPGGSEADSAAPPDPFELAWQDEKNFAAAAIALQASLSSLGDTDGAPRDLQSPPVDVAPAQSHQASEPPSAEPTDPPRSYIEPPDFVFAPPAREPDREVEIESNEQAGQAHPLLPGTELLPDPGDDPADLFEAMPQGGGVAAPSAPTTIPETPAAATPPTQLPTPQLRIAAGSAIRPSPRPAPSNPLAALRLLSEEELLALFG